MVKEENTTIDGFPVRSAKDSKLVARSKADKIPANKAKKKPASKKRASAPKKPVAKKPASKSSASKSRKTSASATRKKPTIKRQSPARIIHAEPETEVISKTDKEIEEEIFGKTQKAHDDFLAPVETFGLNETEDTGTSEGRVEEVEELEVADMKARKKAEKKAKKLEEKSGKKKHKVLKIVLIILLLLIVGGGVAFYFWGDAILKKLTGGNGDIWSAIGVVTSDTYEPLKEDANGRTNILIFGTSGYDMEGTNGDYTHDGAQLTDSIMIVSLNQDTGDVAMVSLPRDLKVSYTCTATGKINEVFWCADMYGNDENAGAEALESEVEDILGIDIQYRVHINWGALVSIVDTLGGITVTLDEDIADYGWTNAVFDAGVPYTINGEEALGLARARHGTESGDFTRGNSQQNILISIKDRLLEKGLGISEMIGVITALGDNVRTNFSMSEIKTGAHLLEELDFENIRQIPLVGEDKNYMTTATINGISYVIPSAGNGVYSQIQEYVKRMMSDNVAVREGAVIEVLNGSGEPGVAGEEKQRLEDKGYNVKNIDDAPAGEYEEYMIYDTSDGKMPETKEALEEMYGVEMKSEVELPAGVSGYGYDFIIIVGAQ